MNHDYQAAARVAAIPTVQAMVAAAGPLTPGGYGSWDHPLVAFHNVAPRTRMERRHMVNRDKIEKDRLRARREKFQSYDEVGHLVTPDAIDSALYQAGTDRFFTDVAAEQRHLRQESVARKQAELVRKRTDHQAREEARWAAQELETHAFADKTKALQQDGRPAMKNKSGQAFNPVTQAYSNGTDGAMLRFVDERTKWKAALRAEYLADHSAGSAGFDPVTGVPIDTSWYKAPPPPEPKDVGLGGRGMSTEEALALSRRMRGGQ